MSELGQKLIEIVRRKAAEQPDFVYTPPVASVCFYVHNGVPSCIIGHALWEAGSINPSIESGSGNNLSIGVLYYELNLPVEVEEVNWLRRVQAEQDNSKSWSAAVAYADDYDRRYERL